MGTTVQLETREGLDVEPTSGRVRAALASARGERTTTSAAVDLAVVAGCIAYAIWSIEGDAAIWALLPDWWRPIDVGAGVLASVLLWWRRRSPVRVAVLLAVLGGVFVGAGVPAVIAVYTVASLRRAWIGVTLAVIHLMIAIPYYLLVPLGDLGIVTWALLMSMIYATACAMGVAVRARRQVIVGLVAAAEAERRDQHQRTERARASERARIAREMHDVLAHRLSILSVHAGALEHRTRADGANPPDPRQVRDAAAVIRGSAHAALEELREVLTVLGSPTDGELGAAAPQPTIADLPRLVAEAGAAGQQVRLQLDDTELLRCRPQLQRTVYRIVQEGLTNARKHAAGAVVDVVITARPGAEVDVALTNPVPVGVTGTEIPGARTGLVGLAERVQLDGGELRTSVRDGRFELEVTLPWRT